MFRVLFFLLALSVGALAKTYTIGVEDLHQMPFYDVQKGHYRGFARDLFDLFASQTHTTFIYKPFPVKRLLKDFLGKEVDFKFPDNPLWRPHVKKGHNITYSKALAHVTGGVVVRKGEPLEQFKVLGVIRGFTPFLFKDAIASGALRIKEGRDYISLFHQLASKHIDGIYISRAFFHYMEREGQLKRNSFVFSHTLPTSDGAYQLSTVAYPTLIHQLDQFMTKHAQEIRGLKARYGVE